MNITFLTAHASKGLGYDNVIVVNGKNETYGFPSKIEDDPVLSFVIKGDRSIDYAEERRLFYVAMTRTKNRVYFIAPEQNPSEFLLEIKREYKNVSLRGNWNEDYQPNNTAKKVCPICGYPLQYRYKNSYGLRLYICTNEPEICGFMTNEYKAGKLSILKCDWCHDGYLVVKPAKDGNYFLGCTNYKSDGSGCKRVIWKEQYYSMMNFSSDSTSSKSVTEEKKDPIKIISQENISKKKETVTEIKKADIQSVLYQGNDLNEIVYTILQALSNISIHHYYGINVLADVLRGANSKKIKNAKLNEINEYGKLKTIEREDVITIIEWLIDRHYILKTKHSLYPVLHPTYEGMHYDETLTARKLQGLLKILENR